ncbi:MAG TPA: Gmad2 immunoglobulin-like domain-containing protein [Gaiellaceae bacterium]|nr:Gmad2 immunoglobulin-like domain-containing protein [Gaiellaceae bacterium]
MTRALLVAALAVVLLAAGCGGDGETTTVTVTTTETATETEPPPTRAVRVYFLREGKVWPVRRDVEEADAVARAALEELLAGPTEQEAADLGLSSALPAGTEVERLTVAGGTARLELSEELPEEPLAQVVYTLTQFPTVESVAVAGRRLTRADFEDLTPAILVESPLAFEEVSRPFRVTGTANTFEATFAYEVTDTDGRIVDEHFVTATSGTGTRGTFDFTTRPFEVPFDGIGALIVFERSAEDGSRIHLVEIPLRMRK